MHGKSLYASHFCLKTWNLKRDSVAWIKAERSLTGTGLLFITWCWLCARVSDALQQKHDIFSVCAKTHIIIMSLIWFKAMFSCQCCIKMTVTWSHLYTMFTCLHFCKNVQKYNTKLFSCYSCCRHRFEVRTRAAGLWKLPEETAWMEQI